jgi:hypothetical protein
MKTVTLDLNNTLSPVTATMREEVKQLEELTRRKEFEDSLVPPQFAHDWYYLDSTDEPIGPISFHDLRKKYHEKAVTGETMLLYGQSSTWKMACGFPNLLESLSKGGETPILSPTSPLASPRESTNPTE